MEIWIPVIIAIVSSLFSYFGSIYQSRGEIKRNKEQYSAELEAIRVKNQADLERLEREHKYELEKLQQQIDAEAKLYEQKAQTDALASFMKSPMVTELLVGAVNKELKKGIRR